MAKQYKSEAMAASHEAVLGLAEAGLMPKRTMTRWRTAPLALCILFAACHAREPDSVSVEPAGAAPGPVPGAVVVNDADLPVDHWGGDPCEIATDPAPVVADGTLTLAVSYSGGCARHDLTLVAASRFSDPDPGRLAVSLAHDANGDPCEAYPTETYRFDLSPVRTLYERTYGRSAGVVRLRLRRPPPSEGHLELTYGFPASP